MTPEQLEALKALLAKATSLPLAVVWKDQLYMAQVTGKHNTVTTGMLIWDADAYVALRNAAPALIAAAEREVKLLEIVANNLPYLENLITLIGHDSAVLRKHSPPCGGHDFCLMKQAQKGAIAIRQALAENAG